MPYIVFAYAIFILIGGIFGHLRSGSLASLISGIIAGLLLIIAAGGMFAQRRWGPYFALIITLLLDAFFSYRFLATFNFIPAGLLSLLSLGMLILLVFHIKGNVK